MRGATLYGGGTAIAVVVALCLSLEGCVGCCTLSLYHGPASALDVRITVLDLDENPGDGLVPVIVQFMYNGNPVQIDPGINVQCNGVAMPWSGAFYGHAERVPMQPPHGKYTIEFTSAGLVSNARVTAPERPVFKSPTIAGATLSRSNNFTIHYVSGGGNSVLGRASDAARSAGNSQVDDGTHDGLDVSGFSPGPGKLSITRIQDLLPSGTGFHSAEAVYNVNRQIAVTWR